MSRFPAIIAKRRSRRSAISVSSRTLNVLIAARLGAGCQKRVVSVDPGIRMHYVAEQMAARLRVALRPWDKKTSPSEEAALDSLLSEAEVIYAVRLPGDIHKQAPNLKWVQTSSAGIDTIAKTDLWDSDVILTNASGVHVIPMREHVLAVMLAFVKNFAVYSKEKEQRIWKRHLPRELCGQTFGVVGLGHIGEEVAKLAKAFGMRIVAMRHSSVGRESDDVVDCYYPPDKLTDMLAECDHILLAVPLTPETTGMIGEMELRAMKETAYIINIARGPVIDEPALIRALKEHWIAGAGLDVFSKEPLPPDSELWTLDNVLFTPHVAGVAARYDDRASDIFCENLRRYLAGQPLVNVIDRTRGY